MDKKEIISYYPNIFDILSFDDALRLHFQFKGSLSDKKGDKVRRKLPPFLKHYYTDKSTQNIIKHNLNWASGNSNSPLFQFIYILLPLKCNQRCYGCFTGQDKTYNSNGTYEPVFSNKELNEIISFAKEHQAKAIVYGGLGELFMWDGAIDYSKRIYESGLKPVIFTNGSLLNFEMLKTLNEIETSLIISIRDTIEVKHNSLVGANNFRKSLKSIDTAIGLGFASDNRLAIEIPVTTDNEERILLEFLPSMRSKGIIPMVEEFLQEDRCKRKDIVSHNYEESRSFFNRLVEADEKLGIEWTPELGTRVLGQPKCQRPLFSFTVFPNRDVADCPAGFKIYGNLKNQTIDQIIYSQNFKNELNKFSFCACSVFYSNNDQELYRELNSINV
jgi:sulfatase maturation enzyme AslB (radical SAM superfamily)